jgi:hypothetical protein
LKLTTLILTKVGFFDFADTKVGGYLKKGITGGQGKRAAVGVGLLVVKPNLLFLGELSLQVVWIPLASCGCARCLIIQVDNAGAMVLFTIHQPSSSRFAFFN